MTAPMSDPSMTVGLVERLREPVTLSGMQASVEVYQRVIVQRSEAAALLTAAEARIAVLEAALEFYAWPENYKGAFVPGGYTDHGTFQMAHHVNLVRKDAGQIARNALEPKP